MVIFRMGDKPVLAMAGEAHGRCLMDHALRDSTLCAPRPREGGNDRRVRVRVLLELPYLLTEIMSTSFAAVVQAARVSS